MSGGAWRKVTSILVWAVSAALAPCGSALAAAAREAAATVPYDLTVLVYAPDVGPVRVAASYAKLLDRGTIREGLMELGRRTGAEIADVRVSDGLLGRGTAELGTAVEFTAKGLVRDEAGALPVGPVVRSMPEWRHMRLVFVVGKDAAWRGPASTTADGFAVRLLSSMPPYEYDVERKSSSIAPSEPPPAARSGGPIVLPALLVGLAAGLGIGWAAAGERARASRRGRA